MPEEAYVGLGEAGVHYMTIYRYVRTGRLPSERVGATWRVAVADLERIRLADARTPKPRGARALRPQRLIDRMAAGDEPGAWLIVEESLTSGATAREVYTDVLVPALRSIGEQWAQGQLSVAAEHRASAVAMRIIGRLGPMFARRGLSRGTVVLGAPEGDFHALPSAIVADLLRGRGFEVLDLGANTPAKSFVDSARAANRLIAVLVGASSRESLSRLTEIVHALRIEAVDTAILVGGGAVTSESAAFDLGADGWSGVDAASVIEAVEGIAASAPR